MFRRRRVKVEQHPGVAGTMRRFFDGLSADDRTVPEYVAHLYGRFMYANRQDLRGRFDILQVDLCVGSVWRSFCGFAVDSDHSMA
jgi:hypothetical protein